MTPNEKITVKEAAGLLGYTPRYVRRLAADGRLASETEETPRGPVLWLRRAEVEAFERKPVGRPKGS